MKVTIEQVRTNAKNLDIKPKGYGHWLVSMDHRGKRISTVTTNSIAIDDYRSDLTEKIHDGKNRARQGYIALCEEIIENNNG